MSGSVSSSRRADSPGPRQRLAPRLAGGVLAALLRLLGGTWRREMAGIERLDRMLARGERVLAITRPARLAGRRRAE